MVPAFPAHFKPAVVRQAFGRTLSSYVIALEAWRRGLRVSLEDGRFDRYEIHGTDRTVAFVRSRPDFTTSRAVRTAGNKSHTHAVLSRAGIPVPEWRLIDTNADSGELRRAMNVIGFPAVAKPVQGQMGQGVRTEIADLETMSLHLKYLRDRLGKRRALIESQAAGEDYRAQVVDGKVVAVCHRKPANVLGDGTHTVNELITVKNTVRKQNPHLSKGLIVPDEEVFAYLSLANMSLDSVPGKGEVIRLRGGANGNAGGDTIDVTSEFPEKMKTSILEAVRAVPGLTVAGVDLLCEHRGSDFWAYTIIELNATPQIGVNMYPSAGEGRDVPEHILNYCFPESERHSEDCYTSVTFDIKSALEPLRTGVSARVELAPMAAEGYPVRRAYRVDNIVRLGKLKRDRLFRWSRELDVSGFLRGREGGLEIVLAGVKANVESFEQRIARTLDVELSKVGTWQRPVKQGFRIGGC